MHSFTLNYRERFYSSSRKMGGGEGREEQKVQREKDERMRSFTISQREREISQLVK